MNLQDTHISAAIRNGGQLMVKQAIHGKWIFHARITMQDGATTVGDISTTEDGAMENLEEKLKKESQN